MEAPSNYEEEDTGWNDYDADPVAMLTERVTKGTYSWCTYLIPVR